MALRLKGKTYINRGRISIMFPRCVCSKNKTATMMWPLEIP